MRRRSTGRMPTGAFRGPRRRTGAAHRMAARTRPPTWLMSSAVNCGGVCGGARKAVAMVVLRRTSTPSRAGGRCSAAWSRCRPSRPRSAQPGRGTCTVREGVSGWRSCSRCSEHPTSLAPRPLAPAPSAGPAVSLGLRWPRCSCRSLRTNSWCRRYSSRSRSLTLIWWASREERRALAPAKTASAAFGAGPAQAMRGACALNIGVENRVVATAMVGWSPFPRQRTRTARKCPGGATGDHRLKRFDV